jgi:hypothetical protein
VNRAAVKRRVAALARSFYEDEDPPVDVGYTLLTEGGDRVFSLGPADGESEADSVDEMLATDRFTIDFIIEVHDGADDEDAEAEAERLFNVFERGLLSRKTLTHPDVPWVNDSETGRPPFDGVQAVRIGPVNGPRHAFPEKGDPYAWVSAQIVCRTALAFQED